MAGVQRHHLTLDPFAPEAREARFRCTHHGCDGTNVCCQAEEQTVRIAPYAEE